MHEDIGRPLAAGQEAEPTQPIEPLDLRPLQPAGRRDADMGARRQHLRGMDRRRLIHRENAEGLIALGALHTLADQARSLIRRLVAIAPKHCNVQKHIRPSIVGNDEAIALRRIEPFDHA